MPAWPRGANENTNGLLRQYLPKGSEGAGLEQGKLDLVEASHNDRLRKTLNDATPKEAFDALLANLAGGGEAQNADGVRCGTCIRSRNLPILIGG